MIYDEFKRQNISFLSDSDLKEGSDMKNKQLDDNCNAISSTEPSKILESNSTNQDSLDLNFEELNVSSQQHPDISFDR